MNISLYMATSLDGVIARNDGSEDFLSTDNWDRFVSLAEEAGAFVVGRNTYQKVKEWDNHSYLEVEAERIVLSDSIDEPDGYSTATGVNQAVEIAEKSDASGLVVTGGSSTNTSFFQENLIDRVYLNVEPVLIGDGINILSEEKDIELKFVRMSRDDDILRLEYRVLDTE